MKLLARAEEIILLAIIRLKDDAYCVPIFDYLQEKSEKKLTLGSIYPPLYRLEGRGFVESFLGEPTAERGGKSKRYYRVTAEGLKALQQMKRLHDSLWEGLSEKVFE